MKYETLNLGDQLLIARDTLRGLESDHFRWTLPGVTASPGAEKQQEENITALRKEVARLEKEFAAEQKKAAPKASRSSKKADAAEGSNERNGQPDEPKEKTS